MKNDLLARKDCEIAKLQEKIIAITKEKEELNADIIEANGWAEILQSKVEFYENIFKNIKIIEFKG